METEIDCSRTQTMSRDSFELMRRWETSMKTPTIRLLGISVITATLITGAIYVVSSYMIRDEIQNSRSIWNNYQRISANREPSPYPLLSAIWAMGE